MILLPKIPKEEFEEPVSVAESMTEEDGSFLVCVNPIEEPDGPFEIRVSAEGEEPVIIQNAYAGEVWLAAGESNMEYPLARTEYSKYLIPKIGKTEVRYYKVPQAGFSVHLSQNRFPQGCMHPEKPPVCPSQQHRLIFLDRLKYSFSSPV